MFISQSTAYVNVLIRYWVKMGWLTLMEVSGTFSGVEVWVVVHYFSLLLMVVLYHTDTTMSRESTPFFYVDMIFFNPFFLENVNIFIYALLAQALPTCNHVSNRGKSTSNINCLLIVGTFYESCRMCLFLW